MLPILLEERKALQGRESSIVHRSREVDVRVTCGTHQTSFCFDQFQSNFWSLLDRCLTSVFSASFICTHCGREFCLGCFSSLESIDASTSVLYPKLVSCGLVKSGVTHGSSLFLPVSRLAISDLDKNILGMKKLIEDPMESSAATDPNSPMSITSETRMSVIKPADARLKPPLDKMEGHDLHVPVAKTAMALGDGEASNSVSTIPPESASTVFPETLVPPLITSWDSSAIAPILKPLDTPSSNSTLTPLPESRIPSPPPGTDMSEVPKDPAALGSLPVQTFRHDELSDEVFQALWARGETMVVTDLLHKMNVQWTPEYFIKHYGTNICSITDCDTETIQLSHVNTFFEQFGKYSNRGGAILKLKDWPPTADFKSAFPALFDDFHRAVPAPNYTRRDGFYNFSAHFPLNAVGPDMGPKMYNAFKSREDGYGSTRLHMDMAGISCCLDG